jgi:membrane-associated phospholipid phosphatase
VVGIGALAAMWLLEAPGHSLSIDRSAFALLSLDPSQTIRQDGPTSLQYATWLLIVVVAAVVIHLLNRHRRVAAATVGVGYPLVLLIAEVLKAIARRPRPPYEVLHAGGFGFPSSDSALSVGFVAIAIVLARALDDARRRRSCYDAGVTLSLFVGVLVIALRDHYLTDVIGGWGLGAATFSGTALVSLWVSRTIARRRA